jgi:hypothetical protein
MSSFLGLFFFLNSDLHTTFSPDYPTDLATLLTYILAYLPTNNQPPLATYLASFYIEWLKVYILKKTFYFQIPSYTLVLSKTFLLLS